MGGQELLNTNLAGGIENLLVNCAGIRPNDRVLLISEEDELKFCESHAVVATANECQRLGASAQIMEIPFQPVNATIPDDLQAGIEQSDVVISFSRLVDQMRFMDFNNCRKCVVNYAATKERLSSPFSTGEYRAFMELKNRIEEMITNCETVEVTCPRGTNFSGPGNELGGIKDDVRIKRFPMLIFTPVIAARFSGRVAMPRIMIGTSRNFYSPYGLQFRETLYADFQNGRLTAFDGNVEDVDRADRHLDLVSAQYGLDRNFVHSWHAGIHPANTSPISAFDDYVLWCNSTFGNPRLLHFHTCGREPPGEISWNVLDPTISFDGVVAWEQGRLAIERIPGALSIADRYPGFARIFANPQSFVGV